MADVRAEAGNKTGSGGGVDFAGVPFLRGLLAEELFAMRKNRPFPAERKVPGLKVSDANKALTATAPVAPLGSRIVSGAKM